MKKERAISVSLTNGAECICDPDIVLGDKYGLWDINNEVSPRGTLLDLNAAWELFISKQGFSSYTFEQHEDSEHGRITYVLVDQDKNPVGPEFTVETDNGAILVPITETITSLTAEKGKYYRIDVPVETLAITLPAMDTVESVKKVGIYFTAGTTPDVTFTAADGRIVAFQEGYEIEADKTYKIDALFDGSAWVVDVLTIKVPFFAKLTLNDGSVVELEGSGQLTRAMVSNQYKSTLVSAEIGELCTSIGGSAFSGCTSLTSITIPDSVTSIGGWAFNRCKSLTSITIPNRVTNIGEGAFQQCGLTSITIPDSVTSIGTQVFYDCTGLTSITIPDSVTSIGLSAFNGCTGLTSVTIGNGVTSIGNQAFQGCTNLTSITIPDSVTSIGSGAFHSCTVLTSITIPDSVTSIGSGAFYGCSGLTSIEIPDSVTNICGQAFNSCTGLTSVTIGSGVTSIGQSAFIGCTGLTSVTSLATTAPTIQSDTFQNVNTGGTLTVPSGSTGYDVWMGTGNYYLGKYNWTKVVPLQPITYTASAKLAETTDQWSSGLHTNAFSGTSGQLTITSHTFENGVGTIEFDGDVTGIGDEAFNGCTGLTNITIPNSVTSIDSGAFGHCTGLTSITIPDSVTSIGDYAFDNCTGLTSVTIGSGVTSIGSTAFHSCLYLTSITIPNSVTSIGDEAFSECPRLTNITIPNSVTSIGGSAFYSCSGLISITIGSGVTSIGYNAFNWCSSLTSITSLATTAPTIDSSTFQDVKTGGTLTVPNGSSGYDVWMGTGDYYLGKYGWTKVEQ